MTKSGVGKAFVSSSDRAKSTSMARAALKHLSAIEDASKKDGSLETPGKKMTDQLAKGKQAIHDPAMFPTTPEHGRRVSSRNQRSSVID